MGHMRGQVAFLLMESSLYPPIRFRHRPHPAGSACPGILRGLSFLNVWRDVSAWDRWVWRVTVAPELCCDINGRRGCGEVQGWVGTKNTKTHSMD